MSGRTSLILIVVIFIAVTAFVYVFSTPKQHMHLAPVVGDNIEKSLPAKDTVKTQQGSSTLK